MAGKSPHAIDRVLSLARAPWAVKDATMHDIAAILANRLRGTVPVEFAASDLGGPPRASAEHSGDVAIIPIQGVIAPHINLLSEICGGATFQGASTALREVLDAGVKTIVLEINSPGGSTAMATEFAAELLAARERVEIVAVASWEMCSAAYWIGACASRIVATPSAHVGSIGVYAIHEDQSKALADIGIKPTFIYAGEHKIEGNAAEPLSDAARARIQTLVNASYDAFVADVARGRRTSVDAVRAGYGKGSVVTAAEALSLGMIDEIATLDAVLARYTAGRSSAPPHEPLPMSLAPAALALSAPRDDVAVERARQQRELLSALATIGLDVNTHAHEVHPS